MEQTQDSNSLQRQNYQIGEVEFNPQQRHLMFGRYRKIKLTQRESLILSYFLERPNQAITLSEIINQCLKSIQCEPMAIRRTIQLLSVKLELADFIEYPYIDCYRFKMETAAQQQPSFNLIAYLKRLFKGENPINKNMALSEG